MKIFIIIIAIICTTIMLYRSTNMMSVRELRLSAIFGWLTVLLTDLILLLRC